MRLLSLLLALAAWASVLACQVPIEGDPLEGDGLNDDRVDECHAAYTLSADAFFDYFSYDRATDSGSEFHSFNIGVSTPIPGTDRLASAFLALGNDGRYQLRYDEEFPDPDAPAYVLHESDVVRGSWHVSGDSLVLSDLATGRATSNEADYGCWAAIELTFNADVMTSGLIGQSMILATTGPHGEVGFWTGEEW